MRIAILGNSGSGKSTLARQFVDQHGLAYLDLDTVAFEPEKIAVLRSPAESVADVQAFCESNDQWVVEGCYANLVQAVLQYSPTLLFLDPGLEVCLSNCRNRPWEPHKYKSNQEQDEKLEFLLSWVGEYYTRDGDLSLAAHHALYEKYEGLKKKLEDLPGAGFVAQSTFYEE